jgi:hypothetical protein
MYETPVRPPQTALSGHIGAANCSDRATLSYVNVAGW